jgi:RHS repeat-associated protein
MGNMTGDGSAGRTYYFDAENRLVKVSGVSGGPYCYVYDPGGLRVAKMTGGTGISCTGGTYTKLYWRSLSGDALGESDGTGSTTNAAYTEYVFFAGRRVASRSGTGVLFYFFADQLGSTRTVTTGNGPGQTPGQLCYDQDYTPYGQEVFTTTQMSRLQTTACPPNYRFTGYEYDSESGLDYAFARYYSSRLGRFLSTDPLGGSVGSLQSHNAHAYTGNNPLNHIDPSGMVDCHPEEGCWALPDLPPFFGPNNPANGCDMADITNCADQQDNRDIASDIAAQNRFAFTAVGPFFQAMNENELWRNGQDPSEFNIPTQCTVGGGCQIFIIGGCVAIRDSATKTYISFGCSGGDWITIQQFADSIKDLPNAILRARLTMGMSPDDIRIYDLANEISERTTAKPCDAPALIEKALDAAEYFIEIPGARWIKISLMPYKSYWGCE